VSWGRAACLSPTTVIDPGDIDPAGVAAVQVTRLRG
jgi:hypothetical protein